MSLGSSRAKLLKIADGLQSVGSSAHNSHWPQNLRQVVLPAALTYSPGGEIAPLACVAALASRTCHLSVDPTLGRALGQHHLDSLNFPPRGFTFSFCTRPQKLRSRSSRAVDGVACGNKRRTHSVNSSTPSPGALERPPTSPVSSAVQRTPRQWRGLCIQPCVPCRGFKMRALLLGVGDAPLKDTQGKKRLLLILCLLVHLEWSM